MKQCYCSAIVSSSINPHPPSRSRWQRWRRRLAYFFGGVAVLGVVVASSGWTAFGKAAAGPRLVRMQQSPQWDGGGFENTLPLYNDVWGSLTGWLDRSDDAAPKNPLPVVKPDPKLFQSAPDSGLRITWLGHSTTLIEVDGKRLLTDPVWGERTSPLSYAGPKRWYAPPIALADLPAIDAVILSHDHYDHLDAPTIAKIKDWDTTFITPLGVGAHLVYWGVPADRIIELDWWSSTAVGDVKVVCTPARHASGRHLFDQNATLWAGYALVGPKHRVYFSGDTGLFPEFVEIGKKYGPFDVTMIEVGAYNRAWPDWHIGPEQAITAHQMLRGKAFIPIHWGLFDLAMHGWTEPVERTMVAAEAAGVRALVPRPGESIEPAAAESTRWWPKAAWETAAEHPIKATGL